MVLFRLVFLTFSILMIENTVSSDTYNINMFIDDVSFIPGAKIVLTLGYKALLLRKEVLTLYNINGTISSDQLEEMQENLNDKLMGIESGINLLSSDIDKSHSFNKDHLGIDQASENRLYARRDNFRRYIREVERLVDEVQEIDQFEDEFEDFTYDTLIATVLGQNEGQLPSILNAIHGELTEEGEFEKGILDILTNNHLTNTLVCRDGVSPFYQMSYLYTVAMKAYAKGVSLNQFAYAYKKKRENKADGYKSESKLALKRFYNRTSEIVIKMRDMMPRASTAFWKCDATDLQENVTYAKLGPIFQNYILKEQDAKDGHTKCLSNCNARKDQVITDKCESDFCKIQTRCEGVLVGCEKTNYQMNICLADLGSGRRYHYVEGKDKKDKTFELFGKKKTCRQQLPVTEKNLIFFACEYCKCTCLMDDRIADIDRYFSLREVTSDIENKKVVTGIRFAKKNHIFHIQIEEGTLLKEGVIEKNSTILKHVDNFSIYDKDVLPEFDYHTIDWKNRAVNLDDLHSTGDKVLTGLKFELVNGAIQLAIQVTPFEFDTGNLDAVKSEWFSSKKDTPRTEIDISERNLPQANTYKHLGSINNQFFKFTTSSFKDDAGQTVVPYIDLTKITTHFRTPLSGAGLIHQANTEKSSGFLSFKLFNYHYVHHLRN